MIDGENQPVLDQNIGNIYGIGNIEQYRKYLLMVLAILKITNVPGHSAQIDRCSQKLLKLSRLAKIDLVHIFCFLLGQSV